MRKRARERKSHTKELRKKIKDVTNLIIKAVGLPDIKIYFSGNEKGSDNSIARFNANGEFIIFFNEGLNEETVKHEITHFMQYYIYGDMLFSAKYKEKFEKAAMSLEKLPLREFIDYVRSEVEINS